MKNATHLGLRGRPAESGVALVIVLLLLTVLTALGFMALYTSTIERDIDRAYRYRLSMKDASEACAQQVFRQFVSTGGQDQMKTYPPLENPGWTFGTTQRHPVIGICNIVDPKCRDPWATANDLENICCCRSGPLLRQNGSTLYVTDLITDGPLLRVKRMPGGNQAGSEGDYGLFPYYVTSGGPSRAVAETKIVVKYGPVKATGCSGEGCDKFY